MNKQLKQPPGSLVRGSLPPQSDRSRSHVLTLTYNGFMKVVLALGGMIVLTVLSVSFVDMVIWALVALVVQVLVFVALRLVFSDLSRSIAENRPAPAILLGVLSLAAGILNAACMVY